MTNPANSTVQNLLPVQAYFDENNDFVTFIGQNKPFYATPDPQQSGLHITNSTIDSTTIGATTPSTGVFTNILTTTGQILTTPTGSTDIVNKQYVDYFAAGLSWKQPATAATLVNITLSGLQTIDGVVLVAGDTVLVKNQTNAAQNGIYVVSAGAWTYSVGGDTWNEYIGAIIFIVKGAQAGTAWYCTAQPGGTLGTTALNWSNFSVASSYSAGTGLTLTGTVFSITNTAVVAGSYGTDARSVTLAINAQGQITSAVDQPIAIAGSQITSGTIGSSYLSGSYSGITGLGTLGNLTVTNAIVGSITGNAATATTATNIAGGAAGSLPYQSAANTTTLLAAGTNGQVLTLASGVPSWATPTTGTVTSVSGTLPISSSGGNTPAISISQAGTASNGYLSSTDWNTFNNKTSNTGTVTSVGGTGTVNGLTLTGTVTTSGSLTLGGTLDLSSPPAIGGTTPAAGTFTNLRVNGTISLAGSTGTSAYVLTSNGASAPTWQAIPASAITVADDTSTNATRYLTFTSATSGTISTVNTSSTKLAYNPSTGLLSFISATMTGTASAYGLKTPNIAEPTTVSATAATGTINYDVTTQSVLYYTSNASANWTVNFRGSSGTSLNTLMATNDTIAVTFMVTQGATAYYNNALTIDGTSVTPKWAGGTVPTSGNASGIDVYNYVITKTASATYTVLASQTQFK